MRKQPYPIAKITGGLRVDLDPLFISNTDSPNLLNCRFEKGLVKKDFGMRIFGNKVLGVPLEIKTYTQTDGDEYLLLLTTTSIYKYDTTLKDWLEISPEEVDIDECETVWDAIGGYKTFFISTEDVLFDTGGGIEWVLNPVIITTADDIYGNLCNKIQTSSLFSSGLMGFKELDEALDLTATTHIHLRVKANRDVTAGEFKLYLCTDTEGVTALEELDLPALEEDEWTLISLELDDPSKLDAIASVALYQVSADSEVITIYIDAINAFKEYTGTVDEIWSSTVLNDIFIFTNYVDPIQQFNGTTVEDLDGSPPRAKYINSFQNRLVAAGVLSDGTAYPFRVQWSSAGTVNNWATGTSGYVDLVDTIDWCSGVKLLADKCFIYKTSSIWELTYVGGTTVFTPKMRMSVNGTEASRSVVSIKDKHVFWSSDAMYAFDGLYSEIIDKNIAPLLYSSAEREVSLTYPKRACATYIDELQEYWIALPSVETPTVATTLFKRHKEGGYTKATGFSISCFGFYKYTKASTPWTGAVGSWLTQTYGSWKRLNLPGSAPLILIGESDGQIYSDDRSTGNTDTMVFETKEFILDRAHRWIEIRVHYKHGPVTVYYSVDGSTWHSFGTLKYAKDWTEGVKYFNITSHKVRFKLETTATEFEFKWLEPWYIPRSRSKEVSSN